MSESNSSFFLFCFVLFILLYFFSVGNVNITKIQYLIITRHPTYNNKDILLLRLEFKQVLINKPLNDQKHTNI